MYISWLDKFQVYLFVTNGNKDTKIFVICNMYNSAKAKQVKNVS